MKKFYIAGPFRATTAWLVEQNIRRAERVGLKVACLGAIPFIPHTMYRFFDGEKDGQFWIDATMELLRCCDAIILLEGWGGSEGSRGEYEEAKKIGMPIFDLELLTLAEVNDWIEEQNND